MADTPSNYSAIDDSEVDAESPITESLATRWRDNPRAAMAGLGSPPSDYRLSLPDRASTAETNGNAALHANGLGGVVFKNPDALGLATSETTTGLRLAPNGAGGTAWATMTSGKVEKHILQFNGLGPGVGINVDIGANVGWEVRGHWNGGAGIREFSLTHDNNSDANLLCGTDTSDYVLSGTWPDGFAYPVVKEGSLSTAYVNFAYIGTTLSFGLPFGWSQFFTAIATVFKNV